MLTRDVLRFLFIDGHYNSFFEKSFDKYKQLVRAKALGQ